MNKQDVIEFFDCVAANWDADMITTTQVRMAVARLELTPAMPIFARIEVNAANTEEPNARTNHIISLPFHYDWFISG